MHPGLRKKVTKSSFTHPYFSADFPLFQFFIYIRNFFHIWKCTLDSERIPYNVTDSKTNFLSFFSPPFDCYFSLKKVHIYIFGNIHWALGKVLTLTSRMSTIPYFFCDESAHWTMKRVSTLKETVSHTIFFLYWVDYHK